MRQQLLGALPAATGWAGYWCIVPSGAGGLTAGLFGLETAGAAITAMFAAAAAGLWLGIAAIPWCARRRQVDAASTVASAAAAIAAGSLGITLLHEGLARPEFAALSGPTAGAGATALLAIAIALRVAPAALAARLAQPAHRAGARR